MSTHALLPGLVLLVSLSACVAELHRAKYQRAFPRTGEQMSQPPADLLDLLSELYRSYEPWILSVVGAVLVGFSGVLPLLIIPLEAGVKLRQREGEQRLRLLLSFAVGGLVGDVFLHLLPEAMRDAHSVAEQTKVGLWVIFGIFFFVVLEMTFSHTVASSEGEPSERPAADPPQTVVEESADSGVRRRNTEQARSNGHASTNGHATANGTATSNGHASSNGRLPSSGPQQEPAAQPTQKQAAGYLNLLANSVDNFTHGLAIGGSFLASTRLGVLTTFAILLHEIPHEVGDFAILLKAGFSRLEAAKAQVATATLGITGAVSALLADDPKALGDRTAWILPFTAGGFIHIALVGVLPEVCKEREPLQCLKQAICMTVGVLLMFAVTVSFEH